jgi:hypothetical protein
MVQAILKNIHPKENTMISHIPDTFPLTHLYTWMTAKQTRLDGILKVHFETKEQYEQVLRNPFQLALSAIDDDCEEIWMYIEGIARPKLKLITQSVVGLGRDIGSIE